MPIRGRGIDLDTMSLAEAQIAASVNIVATSSATGTTAITTGVFTVENPGVFYVEVWSPQLTRGTTNLDLELFEGATAAAGTFLTSLLHVTAALGIGASFLTARRTLAAGNHQLTVTGFVDGGTGVFGAGAGTTGVIPNAWIRVRPA
jgi:hypothetical protein